MADRHLEPDSPELRARWGGFAWTPANAEKAREMAEMHCEWLSANDNAPIAAPTETAMRA